MKAVLLAGGLGTRLRPYTVTVPKPLLPLGEMPVLEVVLRQLARAGVSEAVLTLAYRANLLRAFFGDGEELGIKLSYLVEDPPLGTAGALGALRDWIDAPVLVVNGDILTDLDFAALYRRHLERAPATTLAAIRRRIDVDFGVVEFHPDGSLKEYREKPALEHHVSIGVNVISPEAVALIGAGERIDMPTLHLRARDRGLRVEGHVADCIWLDIGRPDDYERAGTLFAAESERFLGGPRPGA